VDLEPTLATTLSNLSNEFYEGSKKGSNHMVAVINSQELVNKKMWNYRPVFLDGNKDAKSVYRFTEEIFNESIKQNTLSPVFDRLEFATRMGVSEKTVQRVISKLMANQKAYIERVSKGQYQATLFNTNIDLPADCIIKNFELETKLLTELENRQQKACNRVNNRANKIANQIDDKTTNVETSSRTTISDKINNEILTTSLLLDTESKLETKPASLEANLASQLSILETNVTVNNVANAAASTASNPKTSIAQIQGQKVQEVHQGQEDQKGQQVQQGQQDHQAKTNFVSSNSQLKNKSNSSESLFAKRLVTEQQRADDLFSQLEDEQQDQLIELTPIIENFWEKTGKLELLTEQWKEYQPNSDWYEFLTEKLMEAIKLAYATRYNKLLAETKLSKEDVRKEAVGGVLGYWQNISNVSQENIVIPPTTLSLDSESRIDLTSLSTTSQQNNNQPSRFDRIMANVIKNETMLNDEGQSIKPSVSNSNLATTSSSSNSSSNSNSNSNKKLNVRELMKQSRETKNPNQPAIKPVKKEDKNVLKTNPYPEKLSGFSHAGEAVFAIALGLDKISVNQTTDNDVNNASEIPVIGVSLNQEVNQSSQFNQPNQSKSSFDNFSDFSDFNNSEVLGHECPQIVDQVDNNQKDQTLSKLKLVSGHSCPQISDQANNQVDKLENDQFDQSSNNSIPNTTEILGHKCPRDKIKGQGKLAKANEPTVAKVIPISQVEQIKGVLATTPSITTNAINKVATTTIESIIAVATSPTASTVLTNMRMRMREVKVLEVNNNNLNNLTLKTLRTSLVDNNIVPSSDSSDSNTSNSDSIETNTSTSTSTVDIQDAQDIQQDQQYEQNTKNQLIENLTKNQNSVLETTENKIDKTTKRKRKNKKAGSNVTGNVSDGVGNGEGQKTLSEASRDKDAMKKRLEMDKVVHKDEFRLWRIIGGDYRLERDEQGNWMLPNKKGTLPKSEYSFWDIASFAQSQSTIAKPIAYAVGSYYRGDNDDVLKNHFQQSRNAYVGSSGRTVELTDEDKARLNQQQIELNRMLLKEELMVQLWDKLSTDEQQKLVSEEIARFKQLCPQYYENWTHQMLINHNREIAKARLAEEKILRRESQISLAS
jgi:hypothetical protein